MADESTGSSKVELKKAELAAKQAAAESSSGPLIVPGPQREDTGWDAAGLYPQPPSYQTSTDPYDFFGGMGRYDPFLAAMNSGHPPGANPFAPAGGGYGHQHAGGAGDPFGLGAGEYGFNPFDPFGMDPYGDDDDDPYAGTNPFAANDPFAAIAAHYGLPPPQPPHQPAPRFVPDPIPPFNGGSAKGGNPFGSTDPFSSPGLPAPLPPPHTVPPISSKHATSKDETRKDVVSAAAASGGSSAPKAAAAVTGHGSNPSAAAQRASGAGGNVAAGSAASATRAVAPVSTTGGTAPLAPTPASIVGGAASASNRSPAAACTGSGDTGPALPFDLSSVGSKNKAANAGQVVGAPIPAEVRRAFAAVDVERCGYVDATELRRALPIVEQQLGTGLSRIDAEALLRKYDTPPGADTPSLLLDVAEFSRLVADLRALATARADTPAFPARAAGAFPRPGALPQPPLRRDVQVNVAASAAAAAKAAAVAAASAATTAAMLSQCEAASADQAEHRAAASKAEAALQALRTAANGVRAANGFATLAGCQSLGGAETSLTQSLEAMQQAVNSVSSPAIAAAEEAAGSAAALFESLGAGADGTVGVSRLRGALASLAGVADVRDVVEALGRFDRSDALSLHQYAQLAREVKVARQMRARAVAGGERSSSGASKLWGGCDSCARGGAAGGKAPSVGRAKPPSGANTCGAADWHPASCGCTGGGRPAGGISEEAMWEDLRTTKRLLRQMAREPGGPLERAGAYGDGSTAAASHALQATARLEAMHPGGAWAEFAAESWSLEDSSANRPLIADVAAILFDFPHTAVRVVATQPASSSSVPEHARSFRRWFPKEDMDTQATVAQGRAVSCRRVLLNSGIEPARIRISAAVSCHSLQPGAARRVHFVFEPSDAADEARRAREDSSATEGTGRGGAGALLTHTTSTPARYAHATAAVLATPAHCVSAKQTGSYSQRGNHAHKSRQTEHCEQTGSAFTGSCFETSSSVNAPTGVAWGEAAGTSRGTGALVFGEAATRSATTTCSEARQGVNGRAVNKPLMQSGSARPMNTPHMHSWGRGAVSTGVHPLQAACGSAAGGWSNGLVDSSTQRLAAARSYALRPTQRAALNYTTMQPQQPHPPVPPWGQLQARQAYEGQSTHRHAGQLRSEPAACKLEPDESISGTEAAAQASADVRQLRTEVQQLRAEMGRAARPSVHDIQIVTMAQGRAVSAKPGCAGRPRPGSAGGTCDGARAHAGWSAGHDAAAGIGWAAQAAAHGGIPIGGIPVRGAPGARRAGYRSAAERERDILSVSLLPSDDPKYRVR